MENNENVSSANAETASKQESEAYVSKKAYEEVAKDMHKFKAKAKELDATVNEYQAKLKALDEEKLMEQQQWKQLAEKRAAELEEEKRKTKETHNRYLRSLKMVELKKELGGSVRDEYLSFASLDVIDFNEDGTLNRDSLVTVANKFRQEHGQLIPKSENVNITGHAASNGEVSPPKTLEQMSMAEKIAMLKQLKPN